MNSSDDKVGVVKETEESVAKRIFGAQVDFNQLSQPHKLLILEELGNPEKINDFFNQTHKCSPSA